MCVEAQLIIFNYMLRFYVEGELPLFTLLPRETVWKIAEGLLERIYSGAQKAKRGFCGPVFVAQSSQAVDPQEFPNSFSRILDE